MWPFSKKPKPTYRCIGCDKVIKNVYEHIDPQPSDCPAELNKRIKVLEATAKQLQEQLKRFEGYFPALR